LYYYLEKYPWLLNLNRSLISKLEKWPLERLLYLCYGLEINYHYYCGMRQGAGEGRLNAA